MMQSESIKFILFGAGVRGQICLSKIGYEKVICFCDNDQSKVGKTIEGKML